MLKQIRDVVMSAGIAQVGVRFTSRAGLLPKSLYGRLPPLGAHPVTSPAGHVFTYVANPDDMIARGVVWGNLRVWEATSLRVFSTLARTSERFLDVGAYSGIYSLVACADGPGEAIAFEPNPAARPFLEANIAANSWDDRITVVPCGASDRTGTARMEIPADTTAARVDPSGTGPTIQLTTIDDVLDGRRVDILKIDVEGLEPAVIEGGRSSIDAHHPAIIAECLSAEAFEAVRAPLAVLGYDSCHHLGPEGPQPTASEVRAPGQANYLWTVGKPAI